MRVERREAHVELKMSLQNKGCEMLNAIDGWDGDGLSDAEDMAPTTIDDRSDGQDDDAVEGGSRGHEYRGMKPHIKRDDERGIQTPIAVYFGRERLSAEGSSDLRPLIVVIPDRMSQFLSRSCVSTIAARVYRAYLVFCFSNFSISSIFSSTMSSSDLEEALRAQLPDSDDDFDWDAVPSSIMSGPLQFDEPTKQSQCTCAAYQYLCSISDKKKVLERISRRTAATLKKSWEWRRTK
ncbi:hypothetical protein L596_016596 [Steinernema carpocapsae]|uniref:Uncharacterized protein n=1 Tax=Steinernema carpocapsae TaxID=34508 RepID=A0A4U5NIE7_STECR|nr:hypothetical protein L596_016596 [Steinernema carpocapsae]